MIMLKLQSIISATIMIEKLRIKQMNTGEKSDWGKNRLGTKVRLGKKFSLGKKVRLG